MGAEFRVASDGKPDYSENYRKKNREKVAPISEDFLLDSQPNWRPRDVCSGDADNDAQSVVCGNWLGDFADEASGFGRVIVGSVSRCFVGGNGDECGVSESTSVDADWDG